MLRSGLHLKLDIEPRLVVQEAKQFIEKEHFVPLPGMQLLYFCPSMLLYHAFAVGGTLQRTVVRDDECSVAGHPHIGLESPVSCPITGFKGPERVLVVFQAPSPV